MIVSIYIEKHDYLINKPQTINFGGKYIYFFEPDGDCLLIKRKFNHKYIENFFNISDSSCKVTLLSAIVGQNGLGKSSILDVIRKVFVSQSSIFPDNESTVLVEINGMTKVLQTQYNKIYIVDEDGINLLDEKINTEEYQSIYYSPSFDLKYKNDFNIVDEYDISLDQFIKKDLENTDEKGTNGNGWKFPLHEELVFKNSMRQIEFLNSSIYKENHVFREVFNIPEYKKAILHFRDFENTEFHNTPLVFQGIIKLILEKIENEYENWTSIRKLNKNDNVSNDAEINRYLLERFIIKSFMSIIIRQMEKSNTWLGNGYINNAYNLKKFDSYSSKALFLYFIENSSINNKPIFNFKEIKDFIDKLDSILKNENNSKNINKQNIKIELKDIKDILNLNRNFLLNLRCYYPKYGGLIENDNYIDDFISFRPTDRNMSSGENALLNFFSKLYYFIQNNLTEESKSLSNKNNYILLLDEADLGFHPIWKKKYINAILKTLPYFFENLEIKPKIQIIVATHDPFTLSDLPINNVVFLQKDGEYSSVISDTNENRIQKTFGANITDLLAHSFFVEDGLIGDFSKSKIKEIIDWINESKELSLKNKTTKDFKKKLDYYKKVINLIDERVVKLKLVEMITDLFPDDDYYNQVIDREIELLENKKR